MRLASGLLEALAGLKEVRVLEVRPVNQRIGVRRTGVDDRELVQIEGLVQEKILSAQVNDVLRAWYDDNRSSWARE